MNLFEFKEEEPLTFSFSRLQKLIADHYITRRKHPTEDLWILNYGPRVQYDRLWTPETLMCRGLVVDEQWNIVARPWPKFFNWEELTDEQRAYRWGMIRDGHARIAQKMDGSLIIVFWYNGSWHCTTRGSFESEQAQMGTALLSNYWTQFEPNHDNTYLFELICPENRIVVDYGNLRALYLLGIVDTKTGRELYTENAGPFPKPRYLTPEHVTTHTWVEPNSEGVVISFDDGFRFKMKNDEYKRLHKLLCHVTPKSIWQMLLDGEDPADLCEKVPDEFFQWVQKTEAHLRGEYNVISTQSQVDYFVGLSHNFPDRKSWAEYVKTTRYPHIVFLMLDNKERSQAIWKLVKPSGRAFRCDDE